MIAALLREGSHEPSMMIMDAIIARIKTLQIPYLRAQIWGTIRPKKLRYQLCEISNPRSREFLSLLCASLT